MSCFTIDSTEFPEKIMATHKQQIIGARRKMSRCPGGRARQPLESILLVVTFALQSKFYLGRGALFVRTFNWF